MPSHLRLYCEICGAYAQFDSKDWEDAIGDMGVAVEAEDFVSLHSGEGGGCLP